MSDIIPSDSEKILFLEDYLKRARKTIEEQIEAKNAYRDALKVTVSERDEALRALAEAQQWIDSEPDWKDKYMTNYKLLSDQHESLLAESKQSAATIARLTADNHRLSQEKMVLAKAVKFLDASCTCLVMGDKEVDGSKHSSYCKIRIQHDALTNSQSTLSELELLQRKAKALDWLESKHCKVYRFETGAKLTVWADKSGSDREYFIDTTNALTAIESAMKGK